MLAFPRHVRRRSSCPRPPAARSWPAACFRCAARFQRAASLHHADADSPGRRRAGGADAQAETQDRFRRRLGVSGRHTGSARPRSVAVPPLPGAFRSSRQPPAGASPGWSGLLGGGHSRDLRRVRPADGGERLRTGAPRHFRRTQGADQRKPAVCRTVPPEKPEAGCRAHALCGALDHPARRAKTLFDAVPGGGGSAGHARHGGRPGGA